MKSLYQRIKAGQLNAQEVLEVANSSELALRLALLQDEGTLSEEVQLVLASDRERLIRYLLAHTPGMTLAVKKRLLDTERMTHRSFEVMQHLTASCAFLYGGQDGLVAISDLQDGIPCLNQELENEILGREGKDWPIQEKCLMNARMDLARPSHLNVIHGENKEVVLVASKALGDFSEYIPTELWGWRSKGSREYQIWTGRNSLIKARGKVRLPKNFDGFLSGFVNSAREIVIVTPFKTEWGARKPGQPSRTEIHWWTVPVTRVGMSESGNFPEGKAGYEGEIASMFGRFELVDGVFGVIDYKGRRTADDGFIKEHFTESLRPHLAVAMEA